MPTVGTYVQSITDRLRVLQGQRPFHSFSKAVLAFCEVSRRKYVMYFLRQAKSVQRPFPLQGGYRVMAVKTWTEKALEVVTVGVMAAAVLYITLQMGRAWGHAEGLEAGHGYGVEDAKAQALHEFVQQRAYAPQGVQGFGFGDLWIEPAKGTIKIKERK